MIKIEPFLTETTVSYKMSDLILAIQDAIREGNEPQIYYLLEKINAADCIDLSLEAAKYGHTKLLRLFRRMGFGFHYKTIHAALPYPECLRYVVRYLSQRLSSHSMDRIIEKCAIKHPLESIYVLEEAGWVLPTLLSQCAAKVGRLDVLEYAFNSGCLLDTTIQYSDGYRMSYIVVCIIESDAQLENRMECLQYVIKNGCKLREEFCEAAARLGEFDILRYLRENPYRCCPWNPARILQKGLARGVIKDYIEYCLSYRGAYCGEDNYICGKLGCVVCDSPV